MSTTLLIARLLLAGFFAVAGTAKFADSQGSRQAIIDFGLPSSLAAPALLLALIHEVRGIGILGSSPWFFSFLTVAVALRRL